MYFKTNFQIINSQQMVWNILIARYIVSNHNFSGLVDVKTSLELIQMITSLQPSSTIKKADLSYESAMIQSLL